jgi:VanZ family protein
LGRIFVISLILIIYGSLYPFEFHSRETIEAPLLTLLHAWPTTVDRGLVKDAVLNILIYIPIGLFGTLYMGKGRPRALAAAGAVVLALILSTSIEIVQLFDRTRTSSALDVATNFAGAAFGAWLAFLYHDALLRFWSRPGVRAAFRPSAALMLLLCWAGAQTFPMIPHLSITQVTGKLSALWHGRTVPAVAWAGAVVDWLAVARLLELVQSPSWFLPVFMLVLPARILIVGRTVTLAELLGAGCAWLLWSRWLCRYENRARWLAWAAGGMLLVRGLTPFQWRDRAAPFLWSPFVAVMNSGLLSGAIFFNKTFLYGTAIRLLADAGYSYAFATAAVAVLLGAIEAVQIHLPGRTPEITDPLYAVILGVVLKLLDSADRFGWRSRGAIDGAACSRQRTALSRQPDQLG